MPVNRMRAVRPAAAALLVAGLFAGAPADARAQTPIAPRAQASVLLPPLVAGGAVVTGCRLDVRLFQSLATGPVDYCRGHLDYAPGALDCYQVTEQVCMVFVPESLSWFESRRPIAPAVFACPERAEPPVCPRLTWR